MAINSVQPIVEADGTMSQVMRSWMVDIENRLETVENRVKSGNGNPNGSVSGELYTIYIDYSTAIGPVLWIKTLPELLGDTTRGWYQVV